MNGRTLRTLGIAVVLLVVLMLVLDQAGDDLAPDTGDKLYPGLREKLNDVTSVLVEQNGKDPVTIERGDAGWRVTSRDGFPADVAKVREVLLAMADAAVVEAKTANPELLGRLGLETPDVENSKGVQVTATAGEDHYTIIFGNQAQGSYRYARRGGEEQSWLVDKNPDIPADAGDWLDKSIVDIESTAIQSVTIVHPDGETISISKADDTATDFTVADIPEGRELSYATVANGIAGALNGLELTDVRHGEPGADATIATFTRFDGLVLTVSTVTEDADNWLSISAEGGPEGEADALNSRLAGWQFSVAGYKANLFKRRWEDILKPEVDETE